MAISSPGIGSGLDVAGLVSKLVAAEGQPVSARLDKREASIQAELSAYGSLKGALSSFQGAVAGLTTSGTFNQRSATTSHEELFSITAGTKAVAGNHSVEVKQLAQAQKLASAAFSDATASIGTGTLTFQFGDTSKAAKSITIDESNNTLEGIRDAINEADFDVSAAIVNGDDGYQLVFSAKESGLDNALKITVSEDPADGTDTDTSGLSQLAYDPDAAVGDGKNLTEVSAATDALAVINGINVSRSTNTINDAIEGVTLTLKKAEEGTIANASIELNTDSASTAIKKFVDGYNKLAGTVNSLGGYDAETQRGGVLLGDAALRGVSSQLRSVLGSTVYGMDGGIRSLADIGIKTEVDGTLSLDEGTLNSAIADNFDDIGRLFSAMGTPTDSAVSYRSSTDATEIGTYDVNITKLATQGSYLDTASSVSSLTIDDSNDTLSIEVNGVNSETISLSHGTYASGDELAAELQSRINGDSKISGAGASVTVSFDAINNRFSFTSERYGSRSSVQITEVEDATASGNIGLTVDETAMSDGEDVEGSIGNKTGTGNGQYLTGEGDAEGLKLLIEGDTTGSRGSVEFSRGIADKLDSLLDNILDETGFLTSRTDTLTSQVESIGDDREALELRLAKIEERYMKQFTALDVLISNMQATSEYLAGQLAALPGMSRE